MFIGLSGSSCSAYSLYRATIVGLSYTPHQCACTCVEGQSSCTVMSVPSKQNVVGHDERLTSDSIIPIMPQ